MLVLSFADSFITHKDFCRIILERQGRFFEFKYYEQSNGQNLKQSKESTPHLLAFYGFCQKIGLVDVLFVQQIVPMSKITLLPSASFNFTAEYNNNPSRYEIVLSPSSSLLALIDYNQVSIFNTTSKQIVTQLNINAVSAVFGINDDRIFLSDSFSLQLHYLDTKKDAETIIPSSQNNQITSLVYSPNFKSIYFLNHTSLGHYVIDFSLLDFPSLNTTCQINEIAIDKASQTIISSSFDCLLCSFSISGKSPIFLKSNKISHCRIGSLNFINGNLAITQDTIVSKYPQIVYVDTPTLQVIAHYNQSSSNLSLKVVSAQNYIVSYGITDDFLWLYRNAFNSLVSQVKFQSKIITASFAESTNEVIHLSLDQSSNQVALTTFSFGFNCSTISSTVNASSNYAQSCYCKPGMLFDSANLACKKMQCNNTPSSPCNCPSGQSFGAFSLTCSLNCRFVHNSLLQVSYGEPSKCSCNSPYEWNAKISDCSLVDCSLIDKSASTSISASCLCTQGYEWNDTNLNCSLSKINTEGVSSSTISYVGLIIGVVFAGLLIILSAVIYYYKKCKKSPQDQPKNYDFPRKETSYEHEPTPRPLAFENNIRTTVELRQRLPSS